MLGNFYNSLKNNTDSFELPKPVLAILDKDLPSGYSYKYNKKKKKYMVTPSSNSDPLFMKVAMNPNSLYGFPEWAKKDFGSTLEYLYKTQKSLKIEHAELFDKEGKKFNFSDLCSDPLGPAIDVTEEYIVPAPFPKGTKIVLETVSGKSKTVTIERIPCEDRNCLKMQNKDFKVLFFEVVCEDGNAPYKINIAINRNNAHNVNEVVLALEFFYGFISGTIKINGTTLGVKNVTNLVFDEEKYNMDLTYWKNLLELEKKMHVRFKPDMLFSSEDKTLYNELVKMFLINEDVTYINPHTYIDIKNDGGANLELQRQFSDSNTVFSLFSLDGPDQFELLGANFSLYTCVVIVDVTANTVIQIDGGVRIDISGYKDNPWYIYKRYETNKKRAEIELKRMQSNYIKH